MLLRSRSALTLRFALLGCLVLCLFLTRPFQGALADGAFVVNSVDDTDRKDAVLTLREAINAANGSWQTGTPRVISDLERAQLGGCMFSGTGDNWSISGGCGAGVFDKITFVSGLNGISPAAALPALTDNGTWIDGNQGYPVIDAGALHALNLDTLQVFGNYITISNISIINSPAGYGDILLDTGKYTQIAYTYLGTIPAATACSDVAQGGRGIAVGRNVSGTSPADASAYIYGNTIGCHAGLGILVLAADNVLIGQDTGGSANGNLIGTNAGGAGLGNSNAGIALYSMDDLSRGSRYNIIRANTIVNNLYHGIYLIGIGSNTNSPNSTVGNRIYGNLIGVLASGTHRGNGSSGIELSFGANNNIIGGNLAADRNTIAASGNSGIHILNSHDNTVLSNAIFANGYSGIELGDGSGTANNTVISGTLIYANMDDGITEFNNATGNRWTHILLAGNGGKGIDKFVADLNSDIPNLPRPAVSGLNTTTGLISGTSTTANAKIEVYDSGPSAIYGSGIDRNGYGQAVNFIGQTITDGTGNWSLPYSGTARCFSAFETVSVLVATASSELSRSTCTVYAPLSARAYSVGW